MTVALQPPTQTSLEIFTARRLSSVAIGVSVEKKLFTVQQAPFQIDCFQPEFYRLSHYKCSLFHKNSGHCSNSICKVIHMV